MATSLILKGTLQSSMFNGFVFLAECATIHADGLDAALLNQAKLWVYLLSYGLLRTGLRGAITRV
jgi:hypothetical protein